MNNWMWNLLCRQDIVDVVIVVKDMFADERLCRTCATAKQLEERFHLIPITFHKTKKYNFDFVSIWLVFKSKCIPCKFGFQIQIEELFVCDTLFMMLMTVFFSEYNKKIYIQTWSHLMENVFVISCYNILNKMYEGRSILFLRARFDVCSWALRCLCWCGRLRSRAITALDLNRPHQHKQRSAHEHTSKRARKNKIERPSYILFKIL